MPATPAPVRIRLSDVARHAGVSSATASMALRGTPGIAAETAARVRRAAEELGYQPDAAAQALARSGNRAEQGAFYGTIGLLSANPVPRSEEWRRSDPFLPRNVIAETAAELGYALCHLKLPQTPSEASSTLRQLEARNVRGILVEAANQPIPDTGFPWDRFAVIVCSPPQDEIPFHSISSHSATEAHNAVVRCHRLGYRRFGLVADLRRFADWLGGFDMAVIRLGLRDAAPFLDLPDWDEDAFLRWFEKERPEVVIANQDDRPVKALARRGLRAPRDFGYCCLDVPPSDTDRKLSGFVQMRGARDQLALELLHGFLRRKEFGPPAAPLTMNVGLQWIEGTTLRRPRKKTDRAPQSAS